MRKGLVGVLVVLAAVPLGTLLAATLLPNSVFYRAGRPTQTGKLVNGLWAKWAALGLPPGRMVTLEVRRKRSGNIQSIPLVVALLHGERYLVSMLGERSDWVRNARAAGGEAVIRHLRAECVVLEDVPPGERAEILKVYLRAAPGARPHFDIGPGASLDEFARIADLYPVFRVVPRPGTAS